MNDIRSLMLFAGIVVSAMLLTAYVVSKLAKARNGGRAIAAVLLAVAALFGALPAIIESMQR
ncbi:hypothetical protein O7598_00510 [Micromonospora sp. WMMC241]|uniref:hypothetical protein n=1 Tax=Micromonospora sp. WMMC241 TaxID=3015159 RepID=UPI0022B6EFF2|nr:hypothetical protein [Micromonospora sp. WMMC241]MCZ7434865.1 hypothetical protein [Micromonospora sp. WMMC241]